MRPSLSWRSSNNMLLHFAPLFTIKFQSHKESKVLILGPPTHSVLVNDLTLSHAFRVLFFYYSNSVLESSSNEIFCEILVDTRSTSHFCRSKLSLELLQRQAICLVHIVIDIRLDLIPDLVFLVDFGLG